MVILLWLVKELKFFLLLHAVIGRKSLKELRFFVYIHALAHIDWSYHELLYLDSLQTEFSGEPVPGCGRGEGTAFPLMISLVF